jgi:hypothetical protein
MYLLIVALFIIQFTGVLRLHITQILREFIKTMFYAHLKMNILASPIYELPDVSHITETSHITVSNMLPRTNNRDGDSEINEDLQRYSSEEDYDGEDDEDYGTDDEDTDDEYGRDIEDYRLIMSELSHESAEREHGHYYIGMPYLSNTENIYILNATISANTFLKFDYSRCQSYVRNTSVFYIHSRTNLEIMKLYIHPDQMYEVVLKTHWLRIVQRTWRKVYRQRCNIIKLRANPRNQEYFRRHGKYMEGTRCLPSIRGMILPYRESPKESICQE